MGGRKGWPIRDQEMTEWMLWSNFDLLRNRIKINRSSCGFWVYVICYLYGWWLMLVSHFSLFSVNLSIPCNPFFLIHCKVVIWPHSSRLSETLCWNPQGLEISHLSAILLLCFQFLVFLQFLVFVLDWSGDQLIWQDSALIVYR